MKKILFALTSLFLLVGCNANTSVVTPKENEPKHVLKFVDNLPVVYLGESTHTTYLLLSQFGSIDVDGVDVPGKVSQLFYEHTVVWKAEAGTELPGADEVKSSVPGATFRGWAYYDEDNDNVFPDYYTTVPAKDGLALKAIFDGTSTGGGDTPATNVTFTITNFANWVPNDGAEIFVWSWGGGSGNGAWTKVELSYQGENNDFHNVSGTFNAPSDITGFNIARCSHGTTLPNWEAVGNSSGRVYNKTADVMIRSGVTSYTAPEFVEYEYNA